MKIKKISKILIIVAMILFSIACSVNATINPDDYKPGNLTASDYNKPFQFAGTILNAIWIIGTVISVLAIMILGIKYMVGSVEQRAEYKKTMMPIIIGIIMLFTTTTIVKTIYNIVQTNFK